MSIGKIMAGCECISEVCEEHGFCMVARLAEVERERDRWERKHEALRQELGRALEGLQKAPARVAAAYEEAASLFYDMPLDYEGCVVVSMIRALARPEETDALDRIRAEERERCANIAMTYANRWRNVQPTRDTLAPVREAAALTIAAAIRADKT